MANQVDIAQTIVNTFAAHMQNALVAAKAVTNKKYDDKIDADNGLQTRERVPPRYVVTTTEGSVPAFNRQDTVVGTEIVRVDKVKTVGFGYGDFERIKTFSDAVESQSLKAAATQLAEDIDAMVLRTAALAAFNWVGTPGQDLDDVDEFSAGYTRLKEEGVEDNDLSGLLTFTDRQKLGKYIRELPAPDKAATDALRRGRVGMLDSIPTMFTQQLPTLTTGTRAPSGAALVNGASQNVNYRSVSKSAAQGEYNSQTLAIDGLAAAATIKAGEVFSIDGVEAYDNRLHAGLGRDQQFTVLEDATADGTGVIAALKIAPAIIVPLTGGGTDDNVNKAHATVTAAPADNAAITFLGAASTAFRQRAILQKQALLLSTANLIDPKSDTFRRQTLRDVPITVRMWWASDFTNATHDIRFDAAVDVNIMDRRRICRVNGV